MAAFVKFENVRKVYQMGEISIEALRDATFEIDKGEICVIVGPRRHGYSHLRPSLAGRRRDLQIQSETAYYIQKILHRLCISIL